MEYPESSQCGNCYLYDFTLNTDNGLANNLYTVNVSTSDGVSGDATWINGEGEIDMCRSIPGCQPVDLDVIIEVFCDDGTLVETITIPKTFVPSVGIEIEQPGCTPGERGIAYLKNYNTGEVCSQMVFGTPGVLGDCETFIPGTLEHTFLIYEGSSCEYEYVLDISVPCIPGTLGCTDSNAFNYDEDAICDDGSCIYCPKILNYSPAVCPGETFCIEFDDEAAAASVLLDYLYSPSFVDGTLVCFDIPFVTIPECNPGIRTMYVSYYCESLLYEVYEDLPNVTIYPELSNTTVQFLPANCGETPQVISSCGTSIITNVIPPVNDPSNPVDGSADYSIAFGFDLSKAGCYDESLFSGTVVIPACTEATSGCPDAFNGTPQIKVIKKED